MKMKIKDGALLVTVKPKDLFEQVLGIAAMTAVMFEFFWYVPEQMGW